MKRLSAKITYPLVLLSIVVTVTLQCIWLHQMFREQSHRTKLDIEAMLTSTAQSNLYKSIDKDSTRHNNFQKFLLSPEWVQVRQGFDDAKGDSSYKSFSMTENIDSAQISMQFVFMKHARKKLWNPKYPYGKDLLKILQRDSLSLVNMKRAVDSGLRQLEVNTRHYTIQHHYSAGSDGAILRRVNGINADFISKGYSYNLDHLYKYQLVIPSLNWVTWYKMRYYLASSLIMLILTVVAFYFIVKLMQKTKIYADAKMAFTSNMTHEIKTPLATVALAIESITKYGLTDNPKKLHSYLDISRQELQRLNVLIEKVLDLNKETGNYQLSPELVDIQVIITEALQSMDIQFEKAKGKYQFLISPEPCFVEADQVHIKNVIYNLIDNALKYTPEHLELVITCTQIRDRVIIMFTDNGPGIPSEFQDNIFDRFFRVPQKGDRHPVTGTGLGLNYVREIVTGHHGTIQVKSDRGKGSSFIINLPAAKHEF